MTSPLNTTSTPPAAAEAARGLLLLVAATTDRPLDRLVAAAALGALDDVHPAYPPASPAVSDLRGPALVDETISALIAAIEAAPTAADRARALVALEELTTPITAPDVEDDPAAHSASRRR